MGRFLNTLAYLATLLALAYGAAAMFDDDGAGRRETRRPPVAPVAPVAPQRADDPVVVVEVPAKKSSVGTAFAIADGWWLTARHVVDQCALVGLLTSAKKGVRVRRTLLHPSADLALLAANLRPDTLPLSGTMPARGSDGFSIGYPQGRRGEVHASLLGRVRLRSRGRYNIEEAALFWAERQRVPAKLRALGGLSGGPMLDPQGQVVGVLVAASRRRGRVTTTHPNTALRLLSDEGVVPAGGARRNLSAGNFSREGERLRRDLTIAKVFCEARRARRRPRL